MGEGRRPSGEVGDNCGYRDGARALLTLAPLRTSSFGCDSHVSGQKPRASPFSFIDPVGVSPRGCYNDAGECARVIARAITQ